MQPQGQTQIIVNRVDYGLDVQAAGDSPRWHHEGSSQSMGEDPPGLGPRGHSASGEPACPRPRGALSPISAGRMGASDGGFGRYQCIEHRTSGARARLRRRQRDARRRGRARVLSYSASSDPTTHGITTMATVNPPVSQTRSFTYGLSDRDVGALRLLRHAGAHGHLHDEEARFRRHPRQSGVGRGRGADLCDAGHRRMDRATS